MVCRYRATARPASYAARAGPQSERSAAVRPRATVHGERPDPRLRREWARAWPKTLFQAQSPARWSTLPGPPRIAANAPAHPNSAEMAGAAHAPLAAREL